MICSDPKTLVPAATYSDLNFRKKTPKHQGMILGPGGAFERCWKTIMSHVTMRTPSHLLIAWSKTLQSRELQFSKLKCSLNFLQMNTIKTSNGRLHSINFFSIQTLLQSSNRRPEIIRKLKTRNVRNCNSSKNKSKKIRLSDKIRIS